MRALRPFLLLSCLSLAAACGGDGGSGDDPDGGTDSGLGDAGDGGVGDGGDGGGGDGGGDGGVDAGPPVMSITDIQPRAASRLEDTDLTISGFAIQDGAEIVLENCDDPGTTYTLTGTEADTGRTLSATLIADVTRVQGLYSVTVTNPAPDSQTDSLLCVFSIVSQPGITVTEVIPTTAFRGVPGDGISSDALITIRGTGFEPTPTVTWIATDNSVSYDALTVLFQTSTEIVATVPSETRQMTVGEYHVFVTNPSQLSAQWLSGVDPGIFTITDTPPPVIDDVDPQRVVTGAACETTDITIDGAGFDTPTVWWFATGSDTCAGQRVDANGQSLCPMDVTASSPTQLTVRFLAGECPAKGPHPILVENPDGQSDIFISIELRSNADGHLDSDAFVVLPATLNTARFKHGAHNAFDVFGNSYIYAVGGQDDAGSVVPTTEFSSVSLFGDPGPFSVAQQYQDANNPRVDNELATPRLGASLIRLGAEFFFIGGASEATDVVGTVNALSSTDRARILSYDESPLPSLPTRAGDGSMPSGVWFYQVSAVGAWGESLPTYELSVTADGEIEVCWGAPPLGGATSFNVYRSLASDGRGQSTTALAFEVAGPCFVDTGIDELTPGPGRLRGTDIAGTGFLTGDDPSYRVTAVVTLGGGGTWETHGSYPITIGIAADNSDAELNWNDVANAESYSVYRLDSVSGEYRLIVGGLTDTTHIDANAAFDVSNQTPRNDLRPLPPGSLSLWEDASVPLLLGAREGLDAVVVDLDPAVTGDITGRIIVAGGRAANDGSAYLRTAESLAINGDGSLGANWTAEAPIFTSARAFYALLTTQGRNSTPVPPDIEEPPCTDLDGDGFLGCACGGDDCDDGNSDIFPGADEICNDGIDQDCDNSCNGGDLECACADDIDNDGFIAIACGGDDCCDNGTEGGLGCTPGTAEDINPGRIEVCGNGIDENCDGLDPDCDCSDDIDGDGHISIQCGGDDCCDVGTDPALGCTTTTAPDINPDEVDICGNGIDENCDGVESFICLQPNPGFLLPGSAEEEISVWERETRRVNRHYQQQVSRSSSLHARAGNINATFAAKRPGLGASIAESTIGGSDEPVYLFAVLGDPEYEDYATRDTAAALNDMEACYIDPTDGTLACDDACPAPDAAFDCWQLQPGPDGTVPTGSFGNDALLYFDVVYPYHGTRQEDIDVGTGDVAYQFVNASISRINIDMCRGTTNAIDPAICDDGDDHGLNLTGLVESKQSANTTPSVPRAYYQLVRMLSSVYVVGGMTATGATDTVEQHQQ